MSAREESDHHGGSLSFQVSSEDGIELPSALTPAGFLTQGKQTRGHCAEQSLNVSFGYRLDAPWAIVTGRLSPFLIGYRRRPIGLRPIPPPTAVCLPSATWSHTFAPCKGNESAQSGQEKVVAPESECPGPQIAARIERVRAAITAAVEATTLRRVAEEVGMSKSGLAKFIAGSEPYSKTRRQLERWYVRTQAEDLSGVTPVEAELALSVLLHDFPAADRPRARSRLMQLLRDEFTAAGGVPKWLLSWGSGE